MALSEEIYRWRCKECGYLVFASFSSDFSGLSIEGKRFGRPFQLVERLACKYLKMGKVLGPPTPTELIALSDTERAVEMHTIPLRAYHGAIWDLKDRWIIQLQHGGTSATDRFTLFHSDYSSF